MSVTKSHAPPSSAMRSTYCFASSVVRSPSRAMLRGLNQPELICRYTGWSGASICTSVRTGMSSALFAVARLRPERGPRRVEPELRLALDRHHVVVLGDRPERGEAVDVDAGDGRLAPQQRARRVEPLLVGVRDRVGEDPRRFVDSHACASSRDQRHVVTGLDI